MGRRVECEISVEFRILGSLEVWSEQGRVPVGGARAECVLAMLLVAANRLVPVSRLVEAAWGQDPPATAAHQVRKIVADLRQRLLGGAELIITDGAGYRIATTEEQLDLSVFEVRLRRAREAAAAGQHRNVAIQLQAAVDLWRGPAFTGMDSAVVRAAAAVLEERRLEAVQWLIDLRLAAGEAREVVPDLRALLGENPLREATRGQLMLALYRSGRQAEALQVYDEGRRLLADELGIDPEPELARLYERILRNDPDLDLGPDPQPAEPAASQPPTVALVAARPAADSPPPRMLPYDLPDFVGRTEELGLLSAHVRDGAAHGLTIVAIDGMAGVGKTSLMLHAAHRLVSQFRDGQLFVDLRGFTVGQQPVEPLEALDVLLRAIGTPGEQIPDDLTARATLWRIQAASRRLMILLDNVAETSQVRPLLPGGSGCLVIISSRSRLTSLDGAMLLSLELPSVEESLELVTRILGPERVAQARADAEVLAVACGRLPLAMRIAAARLHNRPQWTIRYLVDRLRNESGRLRELSVDDRSVAAAIGLSYQSLGADHQRMFRLLGLRPDTDVDVYAAAAMADIPYEKAEMLLEDLLDVRLLIQREPGRYTFHDIVRSFAHGTALSIESESGRADALARLYDYYLRTADAAADLNQPGRLHFDLDYTHPPADIPPFVDRDGAMDWFDAEYRSLLAIVHRAPADSLDHHACHLPRAMAYYLQLRGRMHELLGVFEVAVAAARRLGDPLLEGRGLINLSLPLWHFGRFAQALDCARQALTIAEDVDDSTGAGLCLGRIGLLLNSFGRYEEALDHLGRAMEKYRAAGIRREQSRALASVSVAHAALGRYEEALEAATQALAIDRDEGDRGSEVIATVNAARARIGLGEVDAALADLRRALDLARAVGTPNGEAVTLACYASLYRRLGRYAEAYETGQQAMGVLWSIRRPAILAAVQNTLGLVHAARGEYTSALEMHRQAHQLAVEMGLRIELARALDGMAHVLYRRNDIAAAESHWRQALEHYTEMGVPEANSAREMLEAATGSAAASEEQGS